MFLLSDKMLDCRLYHLPTEKKRAIPKHLEALQVAVAAVLGDEGGGGSLGHLFSQLLRVGALS